MELIERLADTLAEITFPVYGIVDFPDGIAYDHWITDTSSIRSSVTLLYKSTLYPPYPFSKVVRPLQIESGNSSMLGHFMLYKRLQEQVQPVRNPFVWEGTITIDGTSFCGAIRYYTSPVKLTGFHFKSEKVFLGGHSYGPSCDEVVEIIEGLQVLSPNQYIPV